ncbi:HPr(Ser) kinase/phosphatase [Spirochaetota bacterium]
MTDKSFTVLDLLDLDLKEHDDLDLHCLCGRKGLGRVISSPDINRPGLALTGFYENFAYQRIQLIGRGEAAYIKLLSAEGRTFGMENIFSFPVPCFIFSNGETPTGLFIENANKADCPVLLTGLSSSELSARLLRVLSNIFAPKTTVHGVLVDVYGIGILLVGESGVGKSETALELIERGHRLVADDVVEIRCVSGNILMGSGANKVIGHHMEIRGLGIINIAHLFGVGAIRDKKQVQLVCALEEWDSEKLYDRIGTDEKTMDILGVNTPQLEIPVKPGRNIPIIIETAAMNERLKKMGYHSAKEFNQNILRWLESEAARTVYFGREYVL